MSHDPVNIHNNKHILKSIPLIVNSDLICQDQIFDRARVGVLNVEFGDAVDVEFDQP